MKSLLSLGRGFLELVLGLWNRISVPEHQTWSFQRNQWIKRLSPNLIIDVGANTGQWARGFREKFPGMGHLVSFEPDSRAWAEYERNLEGHQSELVRCAAGSFAGTAKLFEWDVSGGSSSLKPLTAQGELLANQKQRGFQAADVLVVRLDEHLQDIVDGLSEKNLYIKVDVQGSELEVLEGLSGIVSFISAIEIEIPLIKVYAGESSTLRILDTLNAWGFTLISAQTERWNVEKMLAADFDALFVKTNLLAS